MPERNMRPNAPNGAGLPNRLPAHYENRAAGNAPAGFMRGGRQLENLGFENQDLENKRRLNQVNLQNLNPGSAQPQNAERWRGGGRGSEPGWGDPQRDDLERELASHRFAALEWGLYLDTHPHDAKALAEHARVSAAAESLKAEYTKRYGALESSENMSTERWTWIDDPWPWDLTSAGSRQPGIG